jgi:hypothetical protein
MGKLHVTMSMLGLAIAMGGSTESVAAQVPGSPAGPFTVDNRAMCGFDYHLGEWVPGDPDAPPGVVIDFAWGIPGKTVIDKEYREVDGASLQVSHGLAGYHYGRQEIEWVSFVRDGVNTFEVMNIGQIEFEPGDVMVRRYRSYDPDTSSREYRETLTPVDENTRRNVVEYRDDERNWKEWAVFTHVRRGARVHTAECAGFQEDAP